MKRSRRKCECGFTVVELMTILVVVVVVALIILGSHALANAKARAIRMACVNSVRQCQLAFIVWSGDYEGRFPMAVSNSLGGTLEFAAGGNAFRHFQVMSNELSTTRIVNCPADTRDCATNFVNFQNQNISYFVGMDANQSNSQAWLCGDRNITNGFASQNELLTLESSQALGWTEQLHNGCGNVALADGSMVQQISNSRLRRTLKTTKNWKNRIALPD
jgi:hypothetical protein